MVVSDRLLNRRMWLDDVVSVVLCLSKLCMVIRVTPAIVGMLCSMPNTTEVRENLNFLQVLCRL